jgi:deoxycytidylate deaminase
VLSFTSCGAHALNAHTKAFQRRRRSTLTLMGTRQLRRSPPPSRAKTSKERSNAGDSRRTELVIGLVASVGIDLDKFEKKLTAALNSVSYSAVIVRLSEQLKLPTVKRRDGESAEAARLRIAMDAGSDLRKSKGDDALAIRAIMKIAEKRSSRDGVLEPYEATAHVIRSLKHPAEVRSLRRVYGPGFYLIGVLADDEARLQFLTTKKSLSEREAKDAMRRDADEDGAPHGQHTRDTFHLADVFIPLSGDESALGLRRFVELMFGFPYHSPTPDERNMFLAYGGSLSSLALARQVGAAIVNAKGDVIGVGCNEVPRYGGGVYTADSRPDARDYQLGADSSDRHRDALIEEIVKSLCPDVEHFDRVRFGREKLKKTRLFGLTEFGRAAHAEMEALLSCARSGSSPVGGTLYTTTFPCHNCAKHIVTSGVTRVVFVEPYPKSLADELHGDAISFGLNRDCSMERVRFEPFVGIGPRRYFDLFSIELGSGYRVTRKHDDGTTKEWNATKSVPRTELLPLSFIEKETSAINEWNTRGERYGEENRKRAEHSSRRNSTEGSIDGDRLARMEETSASHGPRRRSRRVADKRSRSRPNR